MAYTTINKSTAHFNTKLYTGNSSTLNVTGVGFQPDFTWIKDRTSSGDDHALYDAVRGVTKRVRSNQNDAENTQSTGLTSFDSDGFTVGTNGASNGNGDTFASWNWKANGTGSANTDGSINSTVSANTTAGFSIVKYTGNGNSTATIGHGLSVAPSMIISKNLSTATNADWCVYHKDLTTDKNLFLNLTSAEVTPSYGTINAPTNSLINVTKGSGNQTNSAHDFIAYCFAEKTGYSKFGQYTANAAVDGNFIYTGFKPAFVLIKSSNSAQAGQDWFIYDSVRDPGNAATQTLQPNTTSAEETNVAPIDILSNGFKLRTNTGRINGTNGEYIYMAFAEAPLVGSNNVPCTAR